MPPPNYWVQREEAMFLPSVCSWSCLNLSLSLSLSLSIYIYIYILLFLLLLWRTENVFICRHQSCLSHAVISMMGESMNRTCVCVCVCVCVFMLFSLSPVNLENHIIVLPAVSLVFSCRTMRQQGFYKNIFYTYFDVDAHLNIVFLSLEAFGLSFLTPALQRSGLLISVFTRLKHQIKWSETDLHLTDHNYIQSGNNLVQLKYNSSALNSAARTQNRAY